ncbi:hypothetical protein K7X08_023285 [Anisodus acutangulus]|uniref:Pentatricopeptide repeat-containing protein n=1 Tax=Anisodus acutangulus TaxID=402998 RepID=A0A9Q1LHN0_9SOLA|nr:hypothetical protein K7X08_023285 [Anisodus acutangulus]
MEKWTAANLSRWHSRNVADGHEFIFIETIIEQVLQENAVKSYVICLADVRNFHFTSIAAFNNERRADYLKNDIPFDVVTFTALLRGFFAENKIKDAVELLNKLAREKICEPNEVMYGTVMNRLSKRGHTEKTSSLLLLMEQGSAKPDIFIYNIVIDALCKNENLDAAINLLNEMKQWMITVHSSYPRQVQWTLA